MNEDIRLPFDLPAVARKNVSAAFDGGRITSDGGVMLLAQAERRLPWIAWAYGASFDRQTERHVPAAGLEILESRYVVDDLVKLLTLRAH
jgi:hypothetical protein